MMQVVEQDTPVEETTEGASVKSHEGHSDISLPSGSTVEVVSNSSFIPKGSDIPTQAVYIGGVIISFAISAWLIIKMFERFGPSEQDDKSDHSSEVALLLTLIFCVTAILIILMFMVGTSRIAEIVAPFLLVYQSIVQAVKDRWSQRRTNEMLTEIGISTVPANIVKDNSATLKKKTVSDKTADISDNSTESYDSFEDSGEAVATETPTIVINNLQSNEADKAEDEGINDK